MPQKPVAVRRRGPQPVVLTLPFGPVRCTWEEAVERLIIAGKAENFSQATIDGYRYILLGEGGRVTTFRHDNHIKWPADMTREAVERLLAELRDAGLAPASVAAYARVIKKFLNFCAERGLGAAPDAALVRAPRVPLMPYPVLSKGDEVRLMSAAESERDRMIVDLWLRTGLRLSEMANVRIEHICPSPDGTYLNVPESKWGIGRVLPLDTNKDRVSLRLERFTARQLPTAGRSGPLWRTNRAENGQVRALSSAGLKVVIRRLAHKAGIHVHPHLFRHTYATRAVRAGVGPLQLQRALGHRTLEMVNRYYRFDPTDLLTAWRRRPD